MDRDLTLTHCPYCGDPITQSSYKWRVTTLTGAGKIPGTFEPLQVVEIYCGKCQTTLSITPVLPKN